MSDPQGKAGAQKRRAYRPKVRGCYQCSQRRVSCDLAQPKCQKCLYKGLQCSGYGTRYRFNNGVASRGFGRGRTMQQTIQERSRQKVTEPLHPTSNTPITKKDTFIFVHDKSFPGSTTPQDPNSENPKLGSSNNIPAPEDSIKISCYGPVEPCDEGFVGSYTWLPSDEGQSEPVDEEICSPDSSASFCICYRSLCDVPPEIQKLLLHFSDHIAFEMMAIDGKHNGFRHLILPMAHQDKMVMNAVAAVSAFHCATLRRKEDTTHNFGCKSDTKPPLSCLTDIVEPMKFHLRTISMLQERQQLSRQSLETQRSVMITLLVLLVGIQVTGSDEFPNFQRALEAAFQLVGGEEGLGNDEVRDFIVRQIRKYHVYAAPFLDVQAGIEILSSENIRSKAFDCLHYCCEQQTDQAEAVAAIENLNQQSHEIYLRQANYEASSSTLDLESQLKSNAESVSRVQNFKNTLEKFPRNTAGQHTLIWATFLAASDCILEEHKVYFRDALYKHYNRSGFGNILTGLSQLEQMWERRSWGEKWTSWLPRSRVFVS